MGEANFIEIAPARWGRWRVYLVHPEIRYTYLTAWTLHGAKKHARWCARMWESAMGESIPIRLSRKGVR
jgi:hypothetical protein